MQTVYKVGVRFRFFGNHRSNSTALIIEMLLADEMSNSKSNRRSMILATAYTDSIVLKFRTHKFCMSVRRGKLCPAMMAGDLALGRVTSVPNSVA